MNNTTSTKRFHWEILMAVFFAALLAFTYYPTFVWMVDRWRAPDSYFAHGFLIPLVTVYWIYQKRKELAVLPRQSDLVGFLILMAGCLLQMASFFLRFYFLSAFSFVVLLIGLVYFLLGPDMIRRIWFPLAFLFLMIPLPLLVIAQTTLKMKFFVAGVATNLINASGIKAVQQGSYVYTPKSVLLVGDPCSGLRSFLAFLCLGLVFAYDEKLSFWKRAVLVISGIPLALISNIVRVYFLGLVGEIYGMQYTGPGAWPHDVSGIVVFIAAFLAFMAIRKKLGTLNG